MRVLQADQEALTLPIMDAVPADPCPHLPIERGPDGTGVGPWVVKDKYRYLRTYLGAARLAMRRWPGRVYIDPFCSTGRIQVRGEEFTRPGGAAEAWHALQPHGVAWTRMLVGDLDGARARACASRLQALGAPAVSFEGPAIDTVPKMVASVPRGALCVAFLDPYNLSLLDFALLRSLANLKKVDLIVHFSTMDLLRNADAELDPARARFDALAPGWRGEPWAAASSKSSLAVTLEHYWIEQVKALGFNCSAARPLVTNESNHGLYRLTFFARHDLPLKLWGDVARGHNRELF